MVGFVVALECDAMWFSSGLLALGESMVDWDSVLSSVSRGK
jgi:hypothetical protein